MFSITVFPAIKDRKCSYLGFHPPTPICQFRFYSKSEHSEVETCNDFAVPLVAVFNSVLLNFPSLSLKTSSASHRDFSFFL